MRKSKQIPCSCQSFLLTMICGPLINSIYSIFLKVFETTASPLPFNIKRSSVDDIYRRRPQVNRVSF